ncbi:MAG: MarR family transcriptional regulator [Candidatus Bathyarchaeota archaeon]|nr:MAG: MarR family transcriptional regulator [Candidatus Bathyarchaeota archaeon]
MRTIRQGGFLTAKIHQLSGRFLGGLLREHRLDINPAQGRILFVLWQHDRIPIHELAERTRLSKSTLSLMLDRLEAAGHLTRVRPETDRRTMLIKLTGDDGGLRRKYFEISEEMDKIYYNGFTSDEIDDYEGYLRRILDNLTRASQT